MVTCHAGKVLWDTLEEGWGGLIKTSNQENTCDGLWLLPDKIVNVEQRLLHNTNLQLK